MDREEPIAETKCGMDGRVDAFQVLMFLDESINNGRDGVFFTRREGRGRLEFDELSIDLSSEQSSLGDFLKHIKMSTFAAQDHGSHDGDLGAFHEVHNRIDDRGWRLAIDGVAAGMACRCSRPGHQ